MFKKKLIFKEVIKNYPKKRPLLSNKYKKIYNNHYSDNRNGAGFFNMLSQKMESWMHKKVSSIEAKDVLEVGAGNLNHLPYEKNYRNYDIVEPFYQLYHNNSKKKYLRNIYSSLSEVDKSYDKIISIATFEHLLNLPDELMQCKKLLKKKGILQIAIPCEGEFAFKLGWMLTTSLAFKLKYNLDYSKIMKYEHVNTIDEILILLNNYFKITKFKRSPFILPIKNLSFYAYIECRAI